MKEDRKYFLRILLLVIFMNVLFTGSTFSQLLTNNNIAITITTGTQVTVKGDIQNQNGTTIHNSGTVDLNGNWIHNAANNCFGTSQGTVMLNGANQSIGGTNSTVFNNLSLQGSGTKTLLINTTSGGANAVPAGVLNVGNVAMDLNGQMLNVTNNATGAITSGTGYILSEDADNSSKINWTVNSVTGAHTFPFGNAAGVLIPFTFNLTSGNAGNVTVSTYVSAPNNTPYPVTPFPVTHVKNGSGTDNSSNTVDRFWEIDPSGSGINATLTFAYAPSENAAGGNINMRAQRWNPLLQAWEPPLAGQSNPTSQSVLVSNFTTFGPWALALESSPLPIELLFFTASSVDNKEVLCTWSTASEINNDFFTVERTENGINFENTGTVDGAGNSTQRSDYSFTDKNPFKGVSYYRLKQTDVDGNFSYSQIVPVSITTDTNFGVTIFPNPASSHFFIQLNPINFDTSQIIFELHDATARKLFCKKLSDLRPLNSKVFQIERNELASGIYFFRVISNNQILSKGKIELN